LGPYLPGCYVRIQGMDGLLTAQAGLFDAKYLAFLETIAHLRPKLHRYCSRMVGSVLDGEDVVQDAIFNAYRKLEAFDDTRPLTPWLFRIAHNQCIDFLRRRRARRAAEAEAAVPEFVVPTDPQAPELRRALEHLVLTLPEKERACVLLKDVFDYSLNEIAELVGSTVGGVKAALNRGRSKLAASSVPAGTPRRAPTPESMRLRNLYIDRFNRKDWNGLRELIAADARVVVADRFAGPLEGAPYFERYDRLTRPWRIASGQVDGEPVLIVLQRVVDVWGPQAIIRIGTSDRRIVSIVDYTHCPWVLTAAAAVQLDDLSSRTRISDVSARVKAVENRGPDN
jgi:RNA polymerase sigma-70 factor (ECF subfamily)